MNNTPIHHGPSHEEKPENNKSPSAYLGGKHGGDERAHLMDGFGLRGDTKLQRLVNRLEALTGIEARGIQRVPAELKAGEATFANYLQVFLVWFSADLTANNIALGLLAPVYGLGLTDAAIIGTFGSLAGSAITGYISSFGPVSGHRTLVFARYTMGYWPSRITVIFNIVVMLGYGLVDCLLAGQILSAVSPNGSLSIIVGTIIAAIISLVVTGFGIKLFHIYERYALIPQVW
jgi:purine-cytosine permease-like protein